MPKDSRIAISTHRTGADPVRFFIWEACAMIAHIRQSDGTRQSVREHCLNVAQLASGFGKGFGLEQTCYLVGLLHDFGKYSKGFARYIQGEAKQTVYHSPQGAIFVYERWFLGRAEDALAQRVAQILSLVIRGHHGGLLDCLDPEGGGRSPYLQSMTQDKAPLAYEEAKENFFAHISSENKLEELFSASCTELDSHLRRDTNTERAFAQGLLARSILSCLVDADRWDSACFEDGCDPFSPEQEASWGTLRANLERHLAQFDRTSPIGHLRGAISDACLKAGTLPQGCYQLNAPTGGGKTLSSLRFALAQAEEHQLTRIVYVIPYNTILEQNSQDIRDALQNDAVILEHYGNFISEEDDEAAEAQHKLLTERWNMPLILTSMVQFLDSAYRGKNSNSRRLHRLAKSVIVFDEIQALPTHCTKLFESLLLFLTKHLSCTVLLCTATPPQFSKFTPQALLSAETMQHYQAQMQRFTLHIEDTPTAYSNEAASHALVELLEAYGSVLVIVNTKATAREVFLQTRTQLDTADILCIHLTTNLCPAHRLAKLQEMKTALKTGRRVFCVATMLIEAGVNLSFPCVVRSFTGLPSILQAGGRCNRHMEFPQGGQVYVWHFVQEALKHLEEITLGQSCTTAVQNLHLPLCSEEALHAYFAKEQLEIQDRVGYPVKGLSWTLHELLGNNKALRREATLIPQDALRLCQSFATAGRQFQVIHSDTIQVLTPYGGGEDLIKKLSACRELAQAVCLLRQAQTYSIALFRNTLRPKLYEGMIYPLLDGAVFVLASEWYDTADFGLRKEAAELEFLSF